MRAVTLLALWFTAMHDFSSKTLSSNMTTCRIRLLVEKNGQVRHLVDFIFNRSTTPGRKKIDQVSDFAFFETSIKFFYLASAITKIRLAYSIDR